MHQNVQKNYQKITYFCGHFWLEKLCVQPLFVFTSPGWNPLLGASSAGYDGIPAQTQSTALKYKDKDQNTMSLVYQSLNLHKSGRWIENRHKLPNL